MRNRAVESGRAVGDGCPLLLCARSLMLAMLNLGLSLPVFAADSVPAGPRVFGVDPLSLVPGSNVVLKLRGLQLDAAAVRFADETTHGVTATIKERKKAEIPAGLEAKEVGDTRLDVSLMVPAGLPPGAVEFRVANTAGQTPPLRLRVFSSARIVDEIEPNDGFREAQTIEPGRIVRGNIQTAKDVDVYRWTGRAGARYRIELFAARGGSLLDGLSTVHDTRGRVLAMNDDALGRDPRIDFDCPVDGFYELSVSDAHDRGGEWYGYELTVEEVSPPVSYSRDVVPILRANCVGCHRPSKTQGGLDLTRHAFLLTGGHEGAAVKPGDAAGSLLMEQISGPEPEMPKDGEPLNAREIEIIRRWIAEGAHDDVLGQVAARRLAKPPVYIALPAVTAMAWAPRARVLAVANWHEVTLHEPVPGVAGTTIHLKALARLVGESPRIESLAFSPDDKLLAVSGGAPSEYGEVQIWDVTDRSLVRSIRTTGDTVFGVSWSPDGSHVAVGGADKMVRLFSVRDGREVMKCDNHLDWVLGTAFTRDGARLVSASRDKALKLIDIASGALVDDVNRPGESFNVMAASTKEDLVVGGTDNGGLRLYRMEPRGGRLAEGDDKENSFAREFERLPGAVQALAFSADGTLLAAAGIAGEARVFRVTDGRRVATYKGTNGPIYALAFAPDAHVLAAAGYDGKVRLIETSKGVAIGEFEPVPITGHVARQGAD